MSTKTLAEVPENVLEEYFERLVTGAVISNYSKEAVFCELVRRHQDSVVRYVGHRAKDEAKEKPARLQDLVEISLKRAAEHHSTYRASIPFRIWLVRFAESVINSHLCALKASGSPPARAGGRSRPEG